MGASGSAVRTCHEARAGSVHKEGHNLYWEEGSGPLMHAKEGRFGRFEMGQVRQMVTAKGTRGGQGSTGCATRKHGP